MKKLGIIGGLGPMASAYFLELVTKMTAAATDQEHMEILLHSMPKIPDRTNYILKKSPESPLPLMVEVGRGLAAAGADVIAMPCITAHFFQKTLEEEIGVPILHAIEETALYLRESGITKIGIMATDGTVESRLFQQIMEACQISCIVPGCEEQKLVMRLIYENVKAGAPIERDLFEKVYGALQKDGAEVVCLGCTELSLIKRDFPMPQGVLDVMEVLARKAVLTCAALKEEYNHLISE